MYDFNKSKVIKAITLALFLEQFDSADKDFVFDPFIKPSLYDPGLF